MSARHLGLVLDWRGTLCGAVLTENDALPTTNEDAVECRDCLKIIAERGSESRPPLHTPPRMEDERGMVDGVFVFHDAFIDGNVFEVVPQLSGNVELTIEYDGDGHLFSLTHTDRADLLRALLHDFHYSPERGGPQDDD